MWQAERKRRSVSAVRLFSQSQTAVGDCRRCYRRWVASLMTARRPCFQQCWLKNQWAHLCTLPEYLSYCVRLRQKRQSREDERSFKVDYTEHKNAFFVFFGQKMNKKRKVGWVCFSWWWKPNTSAVFDTSGFSVLLFFVFAAMDITKDPCQNVKCSRHKMCVAQGYQRAMCVNRKKLEHRWVEAGFPPRRVDVVIRRVVVSTADSLRVSIWVEMYRFSTQRRRESRVRSEVTAAPTPTAVTNEWTAGGETEHGQLWRQLGHQICPLNISIWTFITTEYLFYNAEIFGPVRSESYILILFYEFDQGK